MALCAIGTCGLNIRVYFRHGWQNTEIAMAAIAGSTGGKWNVICRQSLTAETHCAAMAL
jgi:hypothetical protein